MYKTISWNTASATERWLFNFWLKKNKKKKRASSAKLQAPSPRMATIKKDNKI